MNLSVIPFVDIRKSNFTALVEQYPEKSQALIQASRNAFGVASRLLSNVALPMGDTISRRWLHINNNPYRHEIERASSILKVKGVFALNLCYEWGCTSAALGEQTTPLLTRVLDWPFPALGENIVVVLQSGAGGDFYNITWPGVSGVYQAMAPQRFAVSLNQAPMRRYLDGVATNWLRNRYRWYRQKALPPAHLLRKVCEEASNYAEARDMLREVPVALPVIYTLTGINAGEGCVIERLEDRAVIRDMHYNRACAANHFESHLNGIGHGWLPRAVASAERALEAQKIPVPEQVTDFRWFDTPIANSLSRLALVANAAEGKMAVMGTDGVKPVTQLFVL